MGGKFKGARPIGKPFPAEFAWNAGFGIYHRPSGFHAHFCIFRKEFPALGRVWKMARLQAFDCQKVVFWHFFP